MTYHKEFSGGFERPLYMGKIRDDLGSETDVSFDKGVVITESCVLACSGDVLQEFPYGLRLGFSEVYDSFQLFKARVLDDGTPCFQVAFGHDAVAKWFTENGEKLWSATPPHYVQMVKRLGFEPITTPEIEDAVSKRKLQLMTSLVKTSIEQVRLVERIEAVYKSVGGGALSLHGGLAVGIASESVGQANLQTYGQREDRDRNARRIEQMKQELVELEVDESDYYRTVTSLLGLDLPTSPTKSTN